MTRIKGPLSLRQALGLSQAGMGRMLGQYGGRRSYTRATICLWERVERRERLQVRYDMTDKGREAYWQALADVVGLLSGGRYRVVAKMGQRVWHFGLETNCARCGRPFRFTRWGIRFCRLHRRS